MPKNLVLDIGNVICRWDPQGLVARVFDDKADQQQAIVDVIEHQDWADLDQGLLTQDEAITRAQERSSLSPDDIPRIFEQLLPSLSSIDTTVEAMHEAKEAGVGMYVLSNMQQLPWEHLERTFDFFKLFDGVVVSYEIKMIKPHANIYNHLTDRFSLQPQDCFFIDDMAVNVQAARECGWESEQLTDTTKGGDLIRSWLAKHSE